MPENKPQSSPGVGNKMASFVPGAKHGHIERAGEKDKKDQDRSRSNDKRDGNEREARD